jgi:cbb3-type cytochrome oxidase subunit 3
MAYLIFGGDMFVTGFMVAVVIWLGVRENNERIAASARIPLDDEIPHG